MSRVLVCPRCLISWAHLDFKHQHGRLPADCLEPTGHFCGECGPGLQEDETPPGSILWYPGHDLDLPLLYALPEDLLRREFFIHLKHLRQGEET